MKPSPLLQLLCLVIAHFIGIPSSLAAEATNTARERNASMLGYLRSEAIRLDATFLEGIHDRAQWETGRPKLHEHYLESLGLWPLPERTPLEATITATLEREEGFTVQTLHFQSRPKLYVTANLYLPKDAKPGSKLPAVLYVCGHSSRGRDGNKTAFQQHGMWFATHGYACLTIDTLQLGEISAIHHGTYRYDRWWWQSRGYTPAAVECWNGIRALDYLQSRPEIDPERLAVTGISGGGAATFWIAAADERVKVAVPVSGMSDLQDYVGAKVVNGHCDCMFMLNPFQWPWTQIAALVAPRPMLFANSGHDTLFPMDSNDRIRARLEKLYGYYTNRTDGLFDIGVVPGGHDDKVELRLMAYRWINRHLRGDDSPVTEPFIRAFEGSALRAFRGELPNDEINTRVDELFVRTAGTCSATSREQFLEWKTRTLSDIARLSVAGIVARPVTAPPAKLDRRHPGQGALNSEAGIVIPWRWLPATGKAASGRFWIHLLDETDSQETAPAQLQAVGDGEAVLTVVPRGTGPNAWNDPAPYYIRRSLPLLGRTVDTCRLQDLQYAIDWARAASGEKKPRIGLCGRANAGVLALYAALLNPEIETVVMVEPPVSHQSGPILPNILRVTDIPDAMALLAPRHLAIWTTNAQAFASTEALYRLGGGEFRLQPVR